MQRSLNCKKFKLYKVKSEKSLNGYQKNVGQVFTCPIFTCFFANSIFREHVSEFVVYMFEERRRDGEG